MTPRPSRLPRLGPTAVAELVRRVDDKRVHGRPPFEQRLAELRQRARRTAIADGPSSS